MVNDGEYLYKLPTASQPIGFLKYLILMLIHNMGIEHMWFNKAMIIMSDLSACYMFFTDHMQDINAFTSHNNFNASVFLLSILSR